MRIQVAATKKDWLDLFEKVDPDEDFKLYRCENYLYPDITPVRISDMPNLGVSNTGIMTLEAPYLIDKYDDFRVRSQTMKGKEVYIVDSILNDNTVTFYHGGIFNKDFFMMGELTAQSKLGNDVMKLFAKAMRKWKRDSGIYFGDDCIACMRNKFFTFDYRYEKWKFFND